MTNIPSGQGLNASNTSTARASQAWWSPIARARSWVQRRRRRGTRQSSSSSWPRRGCYSDCIESVGRIGGSGARSAPHTVMTTFPRARIVSRYRMASGTSLNG